MPDNPNSQYANSALIRTIELQSVATWMLVGMIQRLETLQRDINAQIAFFDPTAQVFQGGRNSQTEGLLFAIESKIKETYSELATRMESDFEELAAIQQEKERDDFMAIFGVEVPEFAIDVAALTVLGLTLRELMERGAGELQFRVAAAIRRGVQNEDTLSQLLARVNGNSGLGNEPIVKVVEPSQRATESLTRTAVESLQEKVREGAAKSAIGFLADNPPEKGSRGSKFIRYGWQSVAVLDSRTTELCRSYHGLRWDRNFHAIGHREPYLEVPRHWSCRSRIVVCLLDEDPSPPGTFRNWMDGLSDEEKRRIFGAKALRLWEHKKISDSDLIRSRERQLTFEDLKKRK